MKDLNDNKQQGSGLLRGSEPLQEAGYHAKAKRDKDGTDTLVDSGDDDATDADGEDTVDSEDTDTGDDSGDADGRD